MDKKIKEKLTDIAEKSIESIRSGKSSKSRLQLRREYLSQLKRLKTMSARRKAIDFYNKTTKILIQGK